MEGVQKKVNIAGPKLPSLDRLACKICPCLVSGMRMVHWMRRVHCAYTIWSKQYATSHWERSKGVSFWEAGILIHSSHMRVHTRNFGTCAKRRVKPSLVRGK